MGGRGSKGEGGVGQEQRRAGDEAEHDDGGSKHGMANKVSGRTVRRRSLDWHTVAALPSYWRMWKDRRREAVPQSSLE